MGITPKPNDWSDTAGWNKYYADLLDDGDYIADISDTGSISLDRIPQLVGELKAAALLNVWVSGCGISILPRLLSAGGLQVHATDISEIAIDFQNAPHSKVELAVSNSGVQKTEGGSLFAEVHDFRSYYIHEQFDFLINVKAFQAFTADEMKAIAAVHFDALKPGGRAVFDTMNVQGERRELVESALVEAGFYLPYYEAGVAYRRQLNETGLPYVFVLGRPIIPWHGEYADNTTKRDKDMAVLSEISTRYESRVQSEVESVKLHYQEHPETKTVSVIYSTG